MPTGYTYIIEDGATFEQYVWVCARAFGALVSMGEDASDAEIPEELKPDTTHYDNSAAKARARLRELQSMTDEQVVATLDAEHATALDEYRKRLEANALVRSRYEAMRERVLAWTPPSSDHRGIRDFMLQQIRVSTDNYEPAAPTQTDPATWHKSAIETAQRDLAYAEKRRAEEIARTNERNKWLRDLRASVPYQRYVRPEKAKP